MKIVLGTAVLAMLISLDGDGSTTYMITGSASAAVPAVGHERAEHDLRDHLPAA